MVGKLLAAPAVAALSFFLLASAGGQVATTPLSPGDDDLVDLRGVIHCHSNLSHDSEGEPERVAAAAAACGLDFVFMTEHPSPRAVPDGLAGLRNGVLFAPGLELGVAGGSLLVLDLRRDVSTEGGAADVSARMADAGALVLAGHIEGFGGFDEVPGLVGMEIYNLHYDALRDGPLGEALDRLREGGGNGGDRVRALLDALRASDDPRARRLLAAFPHLARDPERVLRAVVDRPALYLERWDEQNRTRRLVGVAGNDSHENVRIGSVQVDTYERSFGIVQTHVLVPRDDARSGDEARLLASIRAALGARRAYVCHEFVGPGTGFRFAAHGAANEPRAPMGGRAAAEPGLVLEAETPAPATIRLLRDGEIVATAVGRTLRAPASEPGVYRIEAAREDVFPGEGRDEWPWIYSNPIWVEARHRGRLY